MDAAEREEIVDLIATGLDPRRYDAYEVMRAEAERILSEHERFVAEKAWDEGSTNEQDTRHNRNPYRITEENN